MRKKILWLSHFVPYPPIGGAFQRSFNLLREISLKNDVYLFAIQHKAATHPENEMGFAQARLDEVCSKVKISPLPSINSATKTAANALESLASSHSLTLHLYEHKSIHKDLCEFILGCEFDIVHFDAISMCVFLEDTIDIPVKVLNHHGAEGWMINRRVKREANPLKKLFFLLEGFKLVKNEARYCPIFDVNTVCSEFDAELLGQKAVGASFFPVENGVDIDYFDIDRGNISSAPSILFAGRLDQYSNKEGILWFCKHIWPKLKEQKPEAKLTIVGNNPPDELQDLAKEDPSVDVTGFVDDVRPYFSQATLAIAPLRDGGGTRIKILDAWSMRVPVVCTTIASEGLAADNERNLLIADDESSFIIQITRLIEDADLARRVGEEGRRCVEERYSWENIGRQLDELYERLLN